MGVGLEPSSELRVKKKRKETTIIEVNAIYSPELLTGWGLYKVKEKGKGKRKRPGKKQSQRESDKANPGVCSSRGHSRSRDSQQWRSVSHNTEDSVGLFPRPTTG